MCRFGNWEGMYRCSTCLLFWTLRRSSSFFRWTLNETARKKYEISKKLAIEKRLRDEGNVKAFQYNRKMTIKDTIDNIVLLKRLSNKESFVTNMKKSPENVVYSLDNFKMEDLYDKDYQMKKLLAKSKIDQISDLHSEVKKLRSDIQETKKKEIERLIWEFVRKRYQERFGVDFHTVVEYLMGGGNMSESLKMYHMDLKVVY